MTKAKKPPLKSNDNSAPKKPPTSIRQKFQRKSQIKSKSKITSRAQARILSLKTAKIVSDEAFQEDLKLLKHYYPDAHCALNFTNAYQLLVATILSAQCTDDRVNLVTPALFDRYPDILALSKARQADLELIIRSTGFYKMKSKNLIQAAQMSMKNHRGEIPRTLEELIGLPGVGRKTANVVLGNVYGIASGVVVDTHVSRLSQRMGWTVETTPEKIEQDLIKSCDSSEWIMLSHYLISHGRAICKARTPLCSRCFLNESCPKNGLSVAK